MVYEGTTSLELHTLMLDEFDPYWHSVRGIAILNWQSTRDIFFTAVSSDQTDTFIYASIICIPVTI